ncbi:MAG: MFS transporter, partial [Bacteroidetes bacterium]|nr:MFS transporter [Bacteroidota bacterium]
MFKELELWKKNLIGLSISQFLYRAATRSLLPYLPLFIKELGKTSFGDTAIWSGWIYSSPFIISFFVTPLWGSYGDKYGRKRIALFAAFGFAAAHFLMGMANSLPMLLVFASLQETFGGFYPASVSLVAANTPKEKTSYALGILQSSSAAGNVVGPVFGGLLAYFVGYQSVFFIVAALMSLGGFVILFFVDEMKFVKETHEYFTWIKNLKYIRMN